MKELPSQVQTCVKPVRASAQIAGLPLENEVASAERNLGPREGDRVVAEAALNQQLAAQQAALSLVLCPGRRRGYFCPQRACSRFFLFFVCAGGAPPCVFCAARWGVSLCVLGRACADAVRG